MTLDLLSLALGALLGAVIGAAALWALTAGRRQAAADLRGQLEAERRINAEKLAAMERAESAMKESFQALASQSLQANTDAFFKQARETFAQFQQGAKADLDKRQQSIQHVVQPMQEKLAKMDEHIRALEQKREGAYQALQTQVQAMAEHHQALRSETGNLVRALRNPQARGSWGEMQLRRVVELTGMMEHVDFKTQESYEGEEGRRRPDCLVHLPGGKLIVIDAKTPLDAYMDAVNPDLPGDQRDAALAKHAQDIRKHARELGSKAYSKQFDTSPDFTVLFLPDEGAFSAALQADPGLIESGLNDSVMVATPTTLIALLKAVAYGWRQEVLAAEAQEIGRLGRTLYDRIGTFLGHFNAVGTKLRQATDGYNKAVGSLERNVLPAARRFEKYEAAKEELAAPEAVEAQPRALQAAEAEPDPEESVART